jgi:CheY-like chemotaxis protein
MMGYRGWLAADGEEGLRLFMRQPEAVQLVISDLVMPTMGGEELYARIQATNPKTKFMIVTGYPLEDEGRQLLERGIVAWLQKPFSIKQLTEAVRKVLDEPTRPR